MMLFTEQTNSHLEGTLTPEVESNLRLASLYA